MNIKELMVSDRIVFHMTCGSHLYGTNIETSDVDTQGIFMVPNSEWLRMFKPSQHIKDEEEDNVFYGLRRYLDLAQTANPTVLEMMWTPEECIRITSPIAERLFEHRHLFVTTKCFWSFSGYAHAQIKKAKGKNKKVHGRERYVNEEGIRRLRELLYSGVVSVDWVMSRFCKDFLKYLMKNSVGDLPTDKTDWTAMDVHLEESDIAELMPPSRESHCQVMLHFSTPEEAKEAMMKGGQFPARPVPLLETDFDLTQYHVSSVEHVPYQYRLYRYGKEAKGVFRSGQVVCESIPKEDEWPRFAGLFVFNEQEYNVARKEWRSYWEWMANRNEARWQSQETGELDYDQKNMMHTVRLLLSGENILKTGEPIVRFTGEPLQFLRDIRAGKFEYEYLLKFAENKIEEMRELYAEHSQLPPNRKSVKQLPHSPNTKKINQLYQELVEMNA